MKSVIIIIGLGILVYWNTFLYPLHLDDFPSIVNNAFIRNIFQWQNIWDFWPCRFITYLSFAFNYHSNGLHVLGYHLFNLAVHLGAAVLVWWLALLTLSTPVMKEEKIARHADLIALFAGLIFVAHPIQTQAVTYIVQRAASLATFFYLASLCFYIKSRSVKEGGFYYSVSLITAVLAMFSKEMAITLPLMILIYEYSFLNMKGSLNWRSVIPFFFILLIIPITSAFTDPIRFQAFREEPSISPMQYLLTQFRVMMTYIRLVFLPLNQNLDYDYSISKSVFELPVLISFSFLMMILWGAKRIFPKYRLVSFCVFWFFLSLLPESSIFPIKDVIFEHRLYLPMVGYSLLMASGVYYLWGKNSLKAMVIVLTGLIIGYSFLTYQRNKVWKDEVSLWSDTINKSPLKARAYNNRGVALAKAGKSTEALADYYKAVYIDPNYIEANFNIGIFFEKHADFKEAITYFTKDIKISPTVSKVFFNRGLCYAKQNNFIQAIADYGKSIEIDHNNEEAYINRGLIYFQENKIAQAFLDFTQAIRINPKEAVAYNNRGNIYAFQGNFVEAILNLTQAIEINPKYAEGYWNRAITYYHLKEYDKAWDDVHKAQQFGFMGDPQFINTLKRVSGRDK